MHLLGRIVIGVIVVVSFIMVACFYFSARESASRRDIYSQAISSSNQTGLVSPLSLRDGDVYFINGDGSYSANPTVRERPRIPVGQEELFGVFLKNKQMIDPEAVRVTVTSNDGEQRLPVIQNIQKQWGDHSIYEASYVPEKPGEYLVSVVIDGTGYGGKAKVLVFDPSLIFDTALSASDLLVDFGKLGIAEDIVRVMPAHRREGFWDIDIPGRLEATFGDDLTGKGVLKIYSLASYKDFVVLPEFYEHIARLDAFLLGKSTSKQKADLAAFPLVNASSAGFSREKMISNSFLDGWRYVHHGHYQAVNFPEVNYIFHGLSRDRKFFVYFEREVRSVRLEELRQESNGCFPDDEDYSCINKAFSILHNANDFNPQLSSLDSFIKTIKVKE